FAMSDSYVEQHDRLYQGLQQTRLTPINSEGTFFLLASYADISQQSEQAFAEWLTVEKGVTAIPLSAFYGNPQAQTSNHQLLRFCFAKSDQVLDDAVDRLKTL